MKYYIEMFGLYESQHFFDFKTYDAAYNYLIHTILKNIPVNQLESRELPEYMVDAVFYITVKKKDKLDSDKDYYIIEKGDDEITEIYEGE